VDFKMTTNDIDFLIITYCLIAFLTLGALLSQVAFRIAEMLGFGNYDSLSYKLDSLYQELETGKEINVKDFLDEN